MTRQQILEKAIQKAIDGYEQYTVDRWGTVVGTRGALKQYKDRKGYWRVTLNVRVGDKWKSKQVLVHRLLAKAFIPNPQDKPFINHINGDRADNRLTNLEWVTASENVQDGFNRGRKAWNKHLKSTHNMDLEDLARELPRLRELAKALWGEEHKFGRLSHSLMDIEGHRDCRSCGAPQSEDEGATCWQHHFQQMVISDDPIKYLGEHLND